MHLTSMLLEVMQDGLIIVVVRLMLLLIQDQVVVGPQNAANKNTVDRFSQH